MGFSLRNVVRKTAPWAGAAIGFVGSGFNPAGAVAGYNVGRGVSSAVTKRPKDGGGGAPDPYTTADNAALGELGGFRGQHETAYNVADAQSQSAINDLRLGGATYSRGYDPSNTAALNSDAFRGRSRTVGSVDTGTLTNWHNGALESYTPATAGYRAPNLADGAGSGVRNEMERFRADGSGTPTLQGAVDVSSVEGFDAGDAVRQYATGAWNQASMGLRDVLKNLDYEAASRHRMKSGWFDEDQGQVVRDTATNLQSEIAKRAVQAAGITADARGRGASLRVQRAGDMDSAAIAAANLSTERGRALLSAAGQADELTQQGRIHTADLEYNALSDSDRTRLEAATSAGSQRLSALEAGTRAGLEQATTVDDMDLRAITEAARADRERANFIDAAGQRRAEFLDTQQFNRDSGVVDATMRRQQMVGSRAEASQDRYYDYLTGGLDRRQQAANAKAERRNNRLQSFINAGKLGLDMYQTWKGGKASGASTSRPRGRQVESLPVTG